LKTFQVGNASTSAVIPSLASPPVRDDAMFGLSPARQVTVAWISMACGMLWALHLVLAAHGVLHDDALSHYLISREAWRQPSLIILHHWGRPVDTLLYMVPALFGLVYARLASLVLMALTVLTTFVLARQLRVKYALVVPLFLWFQPWFLTWAGQPSMTEIPFSLMLVLSASLVASNRAALASIVIGLFPLVRTEALALTGLWLAVCVWQRAWRGALTVALPVAVYGVLSLAIGGPPEGRFPLNLLALVGYVPHFSHAIPFRIMNWLSYPKLLLLGAGLPLTALSMYGLPRLIVIPAVRGILAGYAVYAAVHLVLYRMRIEGWPEDRYWLPLAPILSIAGALGLERVIGCIRTRGTRGGKFAAGSVRLGAIVAAVLLVAVVVSGLRVRPISFDPEEEVSKAAVAWLRHERLTDAPILSASSGWVNYLLPGHFAESGGLQSDWPPGSIAVWDSELSENWGISWATLSSDPKWKPQKTFREGKIRIVIFRKILP
jgi:hypothetical protein